MTCRLLESNPPCTCSYTITLTFVERPIIISPNSVELSYNEREAVNIRCEAIAKPEPDVRWIHHGQVKSYGNKTAELTFKTITKSDAGVYTCRANNSAGTAERKLRLAIKCKYIHCSKTHHFLFIVDLLFICHNYFCKKKKKNVRWGLFNHFNITTWKYVVEIIYSFHSLFKLIVESNKWGNANTYLKVFCQSQIWRKRYENFWLPKCCMKLVSQT